MRSSHLLVIALLAIFVVGCGSSQTGPRSNPYVGGTDGLMLKFAPNAPPAEVYDDSQFEFGVSVDITNKGEYSLEPDDGYLEIEGINPSSFNVNDADMIQQIPELTGTKKNFDNSITPGYQDIVSFKSLKFTDNLAGNLDVDLRVSACYNYETRATGNLCVKKESVDNVQENEVCLLSDTKSIANSGGPLQITQISQVPKGKKGFQVSFTISHEGGPDTYFYKEDTECDTRVNNPDRYQVYVEVDPIIKNSVRAKCTGFQEGGNGDSGYITMFQGADRQISCSFDTSSVSRDFIEPFNVRLRYRYQQFITTPITIRVLNTNEKN